MSQLTAQSAATPKVVAMTRLSKRERLLFMHSPLTRSSGLKPNELMKATSVRAWERGGEWG